MLSRFSRWLTHPRWPLMLMVPALVLSLPALWGGLAMDDYVLWGKLNGTIPIKPDSTILLELFRFMPGTAAENDHIIQAGFSPWWADPELKLAFFRPLSSASHVLDSVLWPDSLPLHHLHSLLWFALAVAMVALLYRRLCGSVAAAGLAGWMFAVEDAHYIPVAWLSNRNALLAVVFGVAAVLLHIQWRAGRGQSRLLMALSAMAAALFCAEVALGAVAYVAAYQLTLDGDRDGRRRGLLRRLMPLAPYVLLVAAWGLLYAAIGFGARGSGMYVDPIREPLDFLRAMAERGPILLMGQWFHGPSDLWMFLPRQGHLIMAAAGAALLAVLGLLFWPLLRRRAEARFWGLGMLLSLVPVCGVFPMDRVLLLPGIGAFGLLACQVRELGWLHADGGDATRPEVGRWRRWLVGGLVVLHVFLAAPMLPARIMSFWALSQRIDEDALALPGDARTASQTYVFLQALETAYVYTPLVRQVSGLPVPRRTAVLAQVLTPLKLHRPDARTLVVSSEQGYFAYPGETLFRGSHRSFRQGQKISTTDMDVQISRITSDGRPAEVIFRFRASLEDPSLRWFQIKDGRLQPLIVPQIGQILDLQAGFRLPEDILRDPG